jgi:hypothetical protein
MGKLCLLQKESECFVILRVIVMNQGIILKLGSHFKILEFIHNNKIG